MRRVLLVEAKDAVRKALLMALRQAGIEAVAVDHLAAAEAVLSEGQVDFVVIGHDTASVLEVLALAVPLPFPVSVVVVLSREPPELGLAAIRQGAEDFVVIGPTAGAGFGVSEHGGATHALIVALQKAEMRRLGEESPRTQPVAPAHASDAGGAPVTLVGQNAKVVALRSALERLAPVRASVLIGGESGTGKELVARALHDLSPWREGPFVPVNCGAIPAGLIESELFGHVRGAFTDAVRDKRGLFEAAHAGTLFLDEIADLPLSLQPKLLRALQEGEIRRVGGVQDLRVQVRVVAATARDLLLEVGAGRFREDLYYRLSALTVKIPALRERADDIPYLAAHFLLRARARLGIAVSGISPDAMRLLVSYPWPGNVRELENTIERAAILNTEGEVDVASLPERLSVGRSVSGTNGEALLAGAEDARGGHSAASDDLSIKRAARRVEEDLIRRALAKTRGNRTRAAELLEISQRALLYKIKEYGVALGADDPPGSTRT